MNSQNRTGKALLLARERYAALGVKVDRALQTLAHIPISLHCWQGDDVGGFETSGTSLGGGLAATGNYPGKARTPDELRSGSGEGLFPHSRQTPAEPARVLRRIRRQKSGPRRNHRRPTSGTGSPGRSTTAWAWTSTRPVSRIRKPPTASRCRTGTRPSGNSGSNTAFAAAKSARPSAKPWADPASPTSGFPTA